MQRRNGVQYVDEDAPTPRRIARGMHNQIKVKAPNRYAGSNEVTRVARGSAAKRSLTDEITARDDDQLTVPRSADEIQRVALVELARVATAMPLVIDASVPLFATGPETTHTSALAYDRQALELVEPRMPRMEVPIETERAPTLGEEVARSVYGLIFVVSAIFGCAAAIGLYYFQRYA